MALTQVSFAAEALILAAAAKGEEDVAYILNTASPSPKYIFILFPGGDGVMNPRMADGKLVYGKAGNFLIRSRVHFVDPEFATVATNSSQSDTRIQVLLDDLNRRFPKSKIYLMGTSRGTASTMALAPYLADKIAGEIHTASMGAIAWFDGKKYKNRQLLVHHRQDGCRVTPFSAAQSAHSDYGTELIVMEGGMTEGNPCEAFGHHGFNGIEKETADAIKNWVKQDR